MQEKAAAKAAAKEALAKSGDAGAAQVEAEEAQKAKLKAAAKERSLASGKAAQASKNSAGVFTAVRELTVKIVKELTAEEKLEKRQKVLAAAGMAATGVAPEKKVAAEDEDEDVEDEDEDEDDDDDDNDEAVEGGGRDSVGGGRAGRMGGRCHGCEQRRRRVGRASSESLGKGWGSSQGRDGGGEGGGERVSGGAGG